MDFLRPRAIPALIAALSAALAFAADDCASLQATYRFNAASGEARLSDLSMSRERSKLYRIDEKGTGPGSFGGSQTIHRPKMTPLAETATLTHTAGDTRLHFKDAAGKPLAEMTINDTGRWTCKGERLERSKERTAGLGDAIRTEKVVETLERNAAGDLVYRETATLVGGKAPPTVTESRFPATK